MIPVGFTAWRRARSIIRVNERGRVKKQCRVLWQAVAFGVYRLYSIRYS